MTLVAHTTPYRWPWSGAVDADRLVVLITGWDDHWSSATEPEPEVLANIERLNEVATTVMTVSHQPPRRTDVVRAPTPLPRLERAISITAAGIDGFFGSDLDWSLRRRGATQLVIAGLGLETTVHSTLRRANDMGLECLLVADACAPVDPALTTGAVSSVEMSGGIFGAVGATRDVVAALSDP